MHTYTNASAHVLSKHQTQIIKEWVAEVQQQVPQARHLSQAVIVDTFPVFLSNLMDTLDEHGEENNPEQVAEEHGEERALITEFTTESIRIEYDLLKRNVLSILAGTADEKDLSAITKTFNIAEKRSTDAFLAKKPII